MDIQTINFTDSMHWMNFLEHGQAVDLERLLKAPLLNPVEDFFRTPGKNIRSTLVEMGFHLARGQETEIDDRIRAKIKLASSIIEAIHGGALIVDDIQDGSVVRRNGPTLHLKYGMAQALNAGNWMYFWALEQIKHLDLSPESKNELVEYCFNLLSRAHMGQALDVGTRIDEVPQARIFETCLAAMELKTGTLMSLAFIIGGAIGEASKAQLKELDELGARLGIALQMFDDLGNFFAQKGSSYKRLEDLKLRRPTWIWAQVSKCPEVEFQNFLTAVRELPDETLLSSWMAETRFKQLCLETPSQSLKKIMIDFELKYKSTHPKTVNLMTEMGMLLENSYVTKN